MKEAPGSLVTELLLPDTVRVDLGLPRLAVDTFAEIQEMRGRVLYAGGRRPAFRTEHGSCLDVEALDSRSYHILVRSRGRLVACARVTPLARVSDGVVESVLGTERLDQLLATIGTSRDGTSEASRWIVEPEFRKHGLGFYIAAASWAVGRWLRIHTGFVMAGIRDGQDKLLIKIGARPVDGFPLIPSEEFDDELRVLYFDVEHPPDSTLRWIDRAAAVLRIECLLDRSSAEPALKARDANLRTIAC
jgi:hypothetical protein